jgi:hypothetical protein
MKLDIEKTAMIRVLARISCALTEAMDEGHCGLPMDQLIPFAEELLEAPKELILTLADGRSESAPPELRRRIEVAGPQRHMLNLHRTSSLTCAAP